MTGTPTAGVSYQLVLSDGSVTLGFMLCNSAGDVDEQMSSFTRTPLARFAPKMAAGEAKWSDQEPPFATIAQEDWTGGRGQEDFNVDKTRWYDSRNACTWIEKQLTLGLKSNLVIFGDASLSYVPPNNNVWNSITEVGGPNPPTFGNGAQKIVLAAGVVVSSLSVLLRKSGDIGGVTVTLETDSANKPSGTAAVSVSISDAEIDAYTPTWVVKTVADVVVLAGTYWLAVNPTAAQTTTTNHVEWYGYVGAASNTISAKSTRAGAWTTVTSSTYYPGYRITATGVTDFGTAVLLFEYYGGLYAVQQPASGASKLYRNGDRGQAKSNAALKTKLNDAGQTGVLGVTKTWTANQWAGCIALIVDGPGLGEYRTISSNDASTLTVSVAWTTTHTLGTAYVILGSAVWTEITAVTLAAPVTDVMAGAVKNGELYFAMQDHVVRRYREYISGGDTGPWNIEEADQTGGGHTFPARLLFPAGKYCYAAGVTGGAYAMRVAKRNIAVGTDLAFAIPNPNNTVDGETPEPTPQEPITGFVSYDSAVYLFTTKRVWNYDDATKTFTALDVCYDSMADEHNGVKPIVWNGMLYFPLGYGLERMMSKQIDDIGPNRGTGLPAGRQGYIVYPAATIDSLMFCLDAGDAGTSSILLYNALGWHELVRAKTVGARIRSCWYQVIPGGPNRLWYSEGNNIYYVLMPAKTSNPWLDSAMRYQPDGEYITSWLDAGLANVDKFMHQLSLNSEGLVASAQYVTAYYQTDTDTDSSAWNLIGTYSTSPYQSLSITSGDTLACKRIRFKFVLFTTDATQTPKIKAWALETLSRMEPRFAFGCNVVVEENATIIDDSGEDVPPTTVAQLDTWAASMRPLTMTCADQSATNRKVILDACPYHLLGKNDDDTYYKYAVALRMIEAT